MDDRPDSESLALLLEGRGFHCLKARGPIAVAELLKKQRPDIILWVETIGNPKLNQDIAQELAKVSPLPVIHLYPRVHGTVFYSDLPQVVESLPEETPPLDVLAILEKTLTGGPRRHPKTSIQTNELAFRNIVSRLRKKKQGSFPDAGINEKGRMAGNFITLNIAERTTLFQKPVAGMGPKPPGWLAAICRGHKM